jgi:hypothetical protein
MGEALTRYFEREIARQENLRFFLLLDSARSLRLPELLRDTEVEGSCLFPGEVPEVLRDAAPFLVELVPRSELVRAFLHEGWTDHWGVALSTRLDFSSLRRHFRNLLKIKTDDGRKLYFRYYDPRVLVRYLPTCSEQELHRFFGPVVAFYLPRDEGPEQGTRCVFDGRKLHRRPISS